MALSRTDTLQDLLAHVRAITNDLDATMTRVGALVNSHVAAMGLSMASLTGPDPVTVHPPQTVPGVVIPSEFPGAGDPAVRSVTAHSAATAGLYEQVLEAIERWETGNYKDPNAGPWIKGWNPGGMKFNAAQTAELGALSTPYVAADGATRYAAFPTWSQGILAHGLFLKHSNYDAARKETTIEGQVYAIWDAGYSERDPDWLVNVTRIAKSLAPVIDTTPTTPPGVSSDELARARSAIGKGIVYSQDMQPGGDDPTKPLPGSILNGSRVCDCSLLVAWIKRYIRGKKGYSTEGMVADAQGQQADFSVVHPSRAEKGHLYCYHLNGTGHTGYISQVVNGEPTAVIHCHSGQAPAIQETDCSIFTRHNALILEYHGPQVA